MKIIGITGKAGSGKSTVTTCLLAELRNRFHPARRHAFADRLKGICREMGWNGVKDKRGRRLLQIIGTEAGRECIGQDVWINVLDRQLKEIHAELVVIEDCRFDNEVEWVRAQGGIILRLWGRQKYHWWNRAYWHKSERVPKHHDFAINTSGPTPKIPEAVYAYAMGSTK